MSVRVMSRIWEASPYSGSHLLVLLALADWANDEGYCWPLVATLCHKARVSRATCHRVLADLERDGVLVRGHRHGHSTMYRLLPGSQTETSQNETSKSQGETSEVSPVRPRTVTEPPEEPPSSAPAPADADETLFPAARPKVGRRKPDLVWDAVMEVCAIDTSSITGSARGAYNRAVADLKAVAAEPEDVLHRAAVFRATWPDIRLTPTALAKHWAQCGHIVASAPAHHLRQRAEQADLDARMREMDAEDERRAQ